MIKLCMGPDFLFPKTCPSSDGELTFMIDQQIYNVYFFVLLVEQVLTLNTV